MSITIRRISIIIRQLIASKKILDLCIYYRSLPLPLSIPKSMYIPLGKKLCGPAKHSPFPAKKSYCKNPELLVKGVDREITIK